MNFSKIGATLLVVVLLIGAGCSSSSNVAINDIPVAPSLYPDWYNSLGFNSDSLSYSGFGMAISSDSADAQQRAEAQARVSLESKIGELTEEIRKDMVEKGSSDAKNTDFIIILRTAHSNIETDAIIANSTVKNLDGQYRAFAEAEITRATTVATLQKGFTGHPRYWGGFSGSDLFTSFFK